MSNVFMVIGLHFGDEGKGTIVDYLVRNYNLKTVVRFNGTSNAAHNIVTSDGRHHTFSQFGSGTFVPGVRTHMSRHCVFDPISLIQEEKHLREQCGITDAFSRFTVDPECLVLTPIHRAMCRAREDSRGNGRHGSTGVGLYDVVKYAEEEPEYAIRVKDLLERDTFEDKYGKLFLTYNENISNKYWNLEDIEDILSIVKTVETWSPSKEELSKDTIFEGAQGVLLDEDYGFYPHTTRSKTNLRNALELVTDDVAIMCRKIGVMRSYMTRHGAGPFPTENEDSKLLSMEKYNKTHSYQGGFRVGAPDMLLTDLAVILSGGINEIAITHMDYHAPYVSHNYSLGFNDLDDNEHLHINHVASTLEDQRKKTNYLKLCKPMYRPNKGIIHHVESTICSYSNIVRIISSGPTAEDKVELF